MIGRRVFDMTTAPFTFVDGVEKAITAAKGFAGDRVVDVAAGRDRRPGTQARADRPGGGRPRPRWSSGPDTPFFATGGLAGPLRLENPTTIVRGDRVTHLVYDVSR